jgi:phage baseplate assembly protein gpV
VVSATSEFVLDAYEEGNPLPKSQTVDEFPPQQRKCELTAIERDTPFRPERVTPKPRIPGGQTAMVVGPDAQAEPGSIDTDEHGRVRVRFAWLDQDKPGQESSCWIRVAQVWAGNAWGGLFVPRVGHEVVVAFAEGDPDRPLIVGSVYNGQAPTPFALPGKASTSGFKTEKVDGSKSTELALDDSSGSIAMTGESIGIDAKMAAGALPLGGVTLGAAMGDVPMAQVALSVTGGVTLIGLTEIALHVGTGKIAINAAGVIELWGTSILANGVPLPGVPPINPMAVKNALDVAKALAPAAIL